MYCLNIKGERVELLDVKSSQLPLILKWYNQVNEYGYATGFDVPVTLQEISKRYNQFLQNPDVFFACIYKVGTNEIIGTVKGILKLGKENAAWINSIFILEKFQKNGFGKDSIFLIFQKIKKEKAVKDVYLSVVRDNCRGVAFWNKMGFLQWGKTTRKVLQDGNITEIIIMRREI